MLYSQFSESFPFLDTPSELNIEQDWEKNVYKNLDIEIKKNTILQQWNIQKNTNIYTVLAKVYVAIFPTQASRQDQKNQQKWNALLNFLYGHSTDFVYDLLEQIADYENRLDALLFSIEHFKITSHDISQKKISIPDSQYIHKLPEIAIKIDELPLPSELKPAPSS